MNIWQKKYMIEYDSEGRIKRDEPELNPFRLLSCHEWCGSTEAAVTYTADGRRRKTFFTLKYSQELQRNGDNDVDPHTNTAEVAWQSGLMPPIGHVNEHGEVLESVHFGSDSHLWSDWIVASGVRFKPNKEDK